MPLYSSPIFPKIILLDIRLAIVGGEGGGGGGGVFDSFNKIQNCY